MTPAARTQAAIEILQQIDSGRQPADRLLQSWARHNRFAGAKDRAAINALVYSVLRRRGELSFAIRSDAPRPLVFAALVLLNELTVDGAAALADGGPHAPALLSQAELSALKGARLPGADAPPHVRGNYPEWLHDELDAAFGPELDAEMADLVTRAPLDLRVNTLKATRGQALAALKEAGIDAEPTPFSPWGLRVESRARIAGLDVYRDGLVEIQDEGSQIACLAAGAAPGEQVVDLCAGGGGKTLALAAAMGNKGQVYACDIGRARLDRLKKRTDRAGVRNVQRRPLGRWTPGSGDSDLLDLEARADCVLIDAPCSGTGAWRRNPDARWRLTPETLRDCMKAQHGLLERAARLVRPGGRIVYVTCSLLPCENTRQVERFLDAHKAFVPRPWDELWPPDVPKPEGPSGPHLVLTPLRSGTDGFFVAVMRRPKN